MTAADWTMNAAVLFASGRRRIKKVKWKWNESLKNGERMGRTCLFPNGDNFMRHQTGARNSITPFSPRTILPRSSRRKPKHSILPKGYKKKTERGIRLSSPAVPPAGAPSSPHWCGGMKLKGTFMGKVKSISFWLLWIPLFFSKLENFHPFVSHIRRNAFPEPPSAENLGGHETPSSHSLAWVSIIRC